MKVDLTGTRETMLERAGYATIGSSVTEAEWLERVPVDGPLVMVAEGLTMYRARTPGAWPAALQLRTQHLEGSGCGRSPSDPLG